MKEALTRFLSPGQRQRLRARWSGLEVAVVRRLFRYTPDQLRAKLQRLGLRRGDTVCMHSSYDLLGGFDGDPGQVIDCVLDVLGPDGTLAMMSMAYTGYTRDYLTQAGPFNARRTVSRMGIITEVFRRRKGVLRSLHPAHPVLAAGRRAAELVAGHETLLRSCGPGSPFARLAGWEARILFFGANFRSCTFLHHLEDRFEKALPVRLYLDEPLVADVIDAGGHPIRVTTLVFDPATSARRDALWVGLEADLRRRGILRADRIGNTRLMLVGTGDLIDGAALLFRNAPAGAA